MHSGADEGRTEEPGRPLDERADADVCHELSRTSADCYAWRHRATLDRVAIADPPAQKEMGGTLLPVVLEGLKLSAPWAPVAS